MQNTNNQISTIYRSWLDAVKNDKLSFDELKSIENDEKEITDRF